jgi:hypothetical protein
MGEGEWKGDGSRGEEGGGRGATESTKEKVKERTTEGREVR